MQNLVIIDYESLSSLSDKVLQTMCKAEFVLTSDEINLGQFLNNLRKKILKNNQMVEAGRTSYIIIAKE